MGRLPHRAAVMPSDGVLELEPGQTFDVPTKELVVRVKVRGYGRGRLTVEAVGPGGLVASASKTPATSETQPPRLRGLGTASGVIALATPAMTQLHIFVPPLIP